MKNLCIEMLCVAIYGYYWIEGLWIFFLIFIMKIFIFYDVENGSSFCFEEK